MRTAITAERLFNVDRILPNPVLLLEDGRIASLSSRDSAPIPADAESIDLPGATLAPSFFDVHIHGAAGHDLMDATPQDLDRICGFLASRGTGSFLATTVTAPLDATLRAVEHLARRVRQPQTAGLAHPIGIHLEGPFLSHKRRGVQPEEHLLAPSIATFDRLFDAAQGAIRLMTLAPELPGAVELAAHAVSRGVRISMGHSDATAAETRAVLAAGASSATHTFNAMRPLDHREPGILGIVLTSPALYAELICDGIHTAQEIVRLWWSAKGPERAILVTDGMSATGMPDGEYQLGGFAVQVSNGRAMARGVLAGSVLTLDRALSNFVQFTGASVEQGLRLITANPAAMTGLSSQAGSLTVGQPANLVAVDAAGKLVASFAAGQRVL
ncbi:MAG TPA: N-acetylglucosamine-6-phosphate deacetylase [Terracidiphilus sp.]|nr:N-acetylglucosamine-6-phosphate deacetylase [Terracidiphilus sp.]